ncbi:hypothetical protein ABW19_dt0205644 [Dactylella cylindrospora]|nr:hypothetical protein ABW19_dt0205644 [Dactylella cylindrospora]
MNLLLASLLILIYPFRKTHGYVLPYSLDAIATVASSRSGPPYANVRESRRYALILPSIKGPVGASQGESSSQLLSLKYPNRRSQGRSLAKRGELEEGFGRSEWHGCDCSTECTEDSFSEFKTAPLEDGDMEAEWDPEIFGPGCREMFKYYRLQLEDRMGRRINPQYFKDHAEKAKGLEEVRKLPSRELDVHAIKISGRWALKRLELPHLGLPEKPLYDFQGENNPYTISLYDWTGMGSSPPGMALRFYHKQNKFTGGIHYGEEKFLKIGYRPDPFYKERRLSDYGLDNSQDYTGFGYEEVAVGVRNAILTDDGPARVQKAADMIRIHTSIKDRAIVIEKIDKSQDPNLGGLINPEDELHISTGIASIIYMKCKGDPEAIRGIELVHIESIRNAESREIFERIAEELRGSVKHLQNGRVLALTREQTPDHFELALGSRVVTSALRVFYGKKSLFGSKTVERIYITFGQFHPYVLLKLKNL